jgi:hypothetical protein
VPTTRIKLSHDLPRVWPRAQQGASPRPTSGLGLGRRSLPRPTPGPRPREESQPRPSPASASGEVSASPDLGLRPTTLQGIHHYPTPSQLPQAMCNALNLGVEFFLLFSLTKFRRYSFLFPFSSRQALIFSKVIARISSTSCVTKT